MHCWGFSHFNQTNMNKFKYQLAKKGKIICAGCGKKTAVQYIETETGNEVGGAMRCDREQNCGYHKKPEINDEIFISKFEPKNIETSYIGLEVLEKYHLASSKSNFMKFLLSKFNKSQVFEVQQKYFLSDLNSQTIFWQIDQFERIRSGKIMAYNSTTGKRIKDEGGKAQINWMHSFLKLSNFNLKQCLFGLHLSAELKNLPIGIVESEKTAVIMSIAEPRLLWMACGSLNGFKSEYLAPLKFRKIIAFPDKGCFEQWQTVADLLNEKGFQISVNDVLESNDNAKIGDDIADLL